METLRQKRRSVKTGRVVQISARKTVRVEVERQIRHPLYKKTIRLKKTFLVHDEKEQCRPGDLVRIVDSRPVSKLKTWRLLEITGRQATEGEGQQEGES